MLFCDNWETIVFEVTRNIYKNILDNEKSGYSNVRNIMWTHKYKTYKMINITLGTHLLKIKVIQSYDSIIIYMLNGIFGTVINALQY